MVDFHLDASHSRSAFACMLGAGHGDTCAARVNSYPTTGYAHSYSSAAYVHSYTNPHTHASSFGRSSTHTRTSCKPVCWLEWSD